MSDHVPPPAGETLYGDDSPSAFDPVTGEFTDDWKAFFAEHGEPIDQPEAREPQAKLSRIGEQHRAAERARRERLGLTRPRPTRPGQQVFTAATAPIPTTALAADRPADADTAIAFDPVPVQPRKTDWTAFRQRLFIRTLAETCSVTDACEAAGVTPRSAYRLRRRPGAESFDRAWAQALQCGIRQLVDVAFERALVGRKRTIFYKGEAVAEEDVPSDRLLMWLLTHYDRSRFGNLSGLLPCHIPDPVGEARGELPGLLDALVDHPVALQPYEVEPFDILWDEE